MQDGKEGSPPPRKKSQTFGFDPLPTSSGVEGAVGRAPSPARDPITLRRTPPGVSLRSTYFFRFLVVFFVFLSVLVFVTFFALLLFLGSQHGK